MEVDRANMAVSGQYGKRLGRESWLTDVPLVKDEVTKESILHRRIRGVINLVRSLENSARNVTNRLGELLFKFRYLLNKLIDLISGSPDVISPGFKNRIQC